jgi:hypothetical protein
LKGEGKKGKEKEQGPGIGLVIVVSLVTSLTPILILIPFPEFLWDWSSNSHIPKRNSGAPQFSNGNLKLGVEGIVFGFLLSKD